MGTDVRAVIDMVRREFPKRETDTYVYAVFEGNKEFAFGALTPLILLGQERSSLPDMTQLTLDVLEVCTTTGFFTSKAEVRRALKAGVLTLDRQPLRQLHVVTDSGQLLVFGKSKTDWLMVAPKFKEV